MTPTRSSSSAINSHAQRVERLGWTLYPSDDGVLLEGLSKRCLVLSAGEKTRLGEVALRMETARLTATPNDSLSSLERERHELCESLRAVSLRRWERSMQSRDRVVVRVWEDYFAEASPPHGSEAPANDSSVKAPEVSRHHRETDQAPTPTKSAQLTSCALQ